MKNENQVDINILSGKEISPSLEATLNMLQCDETNPLYQQLTELFNEQRPVVEKLIEPKGAFCQGILFRNGANDDLPNGRRVIYLLSTLGKPICDYIDKCVQEDMLKGLLVDYMADTCLFAFEAQLQEAIRNYCCEQCIGVTNVYEAPDLIPMECQRDAFDILDAGNTLGLSITGGHMLDPVKSIGHIYTISDNPGEFNTEHDCSNCQMNNCPMRGMKLPAQ